MPDDARPPDALRRGPDRPRELHPWAPGPAPLPLDQDLKNGAVYVAPGGAYVYAAYLPSEGGWKLMTEERREGRDYVVNKDRTVSVDWESDGWAAPIADILEEFRKTRYVVSERCPDCGVYMLPEHDDYCDHRIRDGQWWRAHGSSGPQPGLRGRGQIRDAGSDT